MKVAAITGFSGAGKTTLVTQLIARYVAEGLRVGAVTPLACAQRARIR